MPHDPSANEAALLDEALRLSLAERIRDGLLPGVPPIRIFAGNGSGWPCAVCDHEIPSDDVELELEFAATDAGTGSCDARIFLVHHACYEMWDSVRGRDFRRRTAGFPDPPPAQPAGASQRHPS